MIAESALHLITDGAHWIQEVVSEVAFFVVELLILDKLLHLHRQRWPRHGRKHG